MEFPESVNEVIRDACRKFPSDITRAHAYASRLIRKLDEFDDLVNTLVEHAILGLVHQRRHHENVQIKNDTGKYSSKAKVLGMSEEVNSVCKSVYLYNIGARTLGMLEGQELEPIADNEDAIADGHHFNANLCRRLRRLVGDGVKVKEAVSEKKLRALFNELQKAYSAAV